MGIATITDRLATNSMPPYIIVSYLDTDSIPAGSDSTALIEIELPGLYTTEPSYRVEPKTSLTSKAYVIDLAGISISCSSTNFTARLLTRNDPKLINTMYEVAAYTAINLSMSDTFSRFIIRNRDVIFDNKIYLFISNAGVMETGDISIELSYLSIHDRES